MRAVLPGREILSKNHVMSSAARAAKSADQSAVVVPVASASTGVRPIGNQALLRQLQPKLTIGEVDDPLEHEADAVAEQVMRMPEPRISSPAPVQVARKCSSCEEEDAQKIQTKRTDASTEAGEAPDVVHDVLNTPGRPLDTTTRAFMEPRFGKDFSDVRIHAGARAAQSAHAIGAQAYTVGRDLVFGQGQYAPHAPAGRQLLAHELAHAVQQSFAELGDGPIRRQPDDQAAPEPQQISSATPTLTYTKKPPAQGECGDYQWQVKFVLNGASEQTNGFIVQYAKAVFMGQDCNNKQADTFDLWWEAWQVKGGKIMSGTSDRESLGDEFASSNTRGTKGTQYSTGAAKFMPNYTEPLKWGKVKQAGPLPATTTQPPGWVEAGSKYRYIGISDYDCCDYPGRNGKLTTEELDV